MINKQRMIDLINLMNQIGMEKQKTFNTTQEKIESQIFLNGLYEMLYKTYTNDEIRLAKDLFNKNIKADKIKRHLLNHLQQDLSNKKTHKQYTHETLLILLALVKMFRDNTRVNLWENMIETYIERIESKGVQNGI